MRLDSNINSVTSNNTLINEKISQLNFDILNQIGTEIGVQEHWNLLENAIINVVDVIVPLEDVGSNQARTPGVCAFIKNKINTKKRLIKLNKRNFSLLVHSRISLLSREIAIHFHKARRSRVQYHATKGGLNLWLAVKLAKDINIDEIPTKLIQYY